MSITSVIQPQSNSLDLSSKFIIYLESLGVSKQSLKHYKSDLFHFRGWALLKVRTWGVMAEEINDVVPFLNNKLAIEYKSFLTNNNISPKTINRRLSTLRHLSKFLILNQILNFDFMDGLTNISLTNIQTTLTHPLVEEFRKQLEKEKVSHNTIKNYLSDIRQFLAWLETDENSKLKVQS